MPSINSLWLAIQQSDLEGVACWLVGIVAWSLALTVIHHAVFSFRGTRWLKSKVTPSRELFDNAKMLRWMIANRAPFDREQARGRAARPAPVFSDEQIERLKAELAAVESKIDVSAVRSWLAELLSCPFCQRCWTCLAFTLPMVGGFDAVLTAALFVAVASLLDSRTAKPPEGKASWRRT